MTTKKPRKNAVIIGSLVISAIWLLGSLTFAAEDVSFKGTTKKLFGGFEMLTGKLRKPQGDGPFPAAVLMHGCSGINKNHHIWANRLVSWGYVAFVLDSFGPRGEKYICADTMRIPSHLRAQDAYDAKSYLSGLPFVDRNRIAVTGFSHRGASTLNVVSSSNYAASAIRARANPSRKQEEPFRAAIAFYPYCAANLEDSNAPLLILIGELDDWCPAALCQKSTPTGKDTQEIILKVYPGAHHGFDTENVNVKVEGHRLLSNPEALADSIVQVRDFLGKHLK